MATVPASPIPPVFHYRYDADNLLSCVGTSDMPQWRYWKDDVVVNAAEGTQELSWAYCRDHLVAALRVGSTPSTTVLGVDQAGSVLREADAVHRSRCYAPYGYASSDAGPSQPGETGSHPGFNGELFDEASGCYLPGAGHHRPYSPVLHCFLAPDSLSPFDEGGLNAYSYCGGDPINRMDPTGHFWKWIVAGIGAVAAVVSLGILAVPLIAGSAALTASAVAGAALSAVGAVAEIGAIAAEAAGDEKAASILGWIGLGVTAVGVVTALPAIAKAAGKGVAKLGKLSKSRGLEVASNPSGGWHTGGYLKLGDGSLPHARPLVDGPEFTYRTIGKKANSGVRFKDLPKEEQSTVLKIVRNDVSSFKYGRDGIVFENKELRLPIERLGHYQEYTVPIYGTSGRGVTRIVAGGVARHGPRALYRTADHYETFTQIRFPKKWPRHPI